MTAPDPENHRPRRRSPRATRTDPLELRQAALLEQLLRSHLQLEKWRLVIYGLNSAFTHLVPLTPLILGAMLIIRTLADGAVPVTEVLIAALVSACACCRRGDPPPNWPWVQHGAFTTATEAIRRERTEAGEE